MELWIDTSDLVAWGCSEAYVKKRLHMNRTGSSSWKHRPHPDDKRRQQIDYDSIPESTLVKLPSRAEIVAYYATHTHHEKTSRLRALQSQYYQESDLRTYLSMGLDTASASGLAVSASWLRLLTSVRGKKDVQELEIPGIETKGQLWDSVLALVKQDKPHGLHRITNKRSLQKKQTQWREAATDEDRLQTLVHGHRRIRGERRGCQNSRKVDTDTERLILSLWVNLGGDNKFQAHEVHANYMNIALNGGVDTLTGEVYTDLPELSLSSVKRVINSPRAHPLNRYRHGEKWYKDAARPYVLGRLPEYAFSLTSSDGETSPFLLKDKKGRITNKRPVAMLIFDVHSEAIIGYSLGMSETHDLTKAAFYDMLVRHGGIRPRENQSDRFSKGAEADLSLVVDQMYYGTPEHPQERYAEPLIRAFERQQLKNIPGYVGTNIVSPGIEGKRNPDLPRHGYTFAEIGQIYQRAIMAWNQAVPAGRRGSKTRQDRLSRVNPGCTRIDPMIWAKALGGYSTASLWTSRHKKYTTRGFVHLTVDGEKQVYELPDYIGLLPHLPQSRQLRINYLPHDLSRVWLYTMRDPSDRHQDEFLCEARLADRTARAVVERTTGDGTSLRHHLGRIDDMEQYTQQWLDKLGTPQPLTQEEAEVILQQGYTNKADMQAAQEALHDDESNIKTDLRWQI